MILIKKVKVFLINAVILTITALFIRIVGTFFNIYISNRIGTESVGVFSLVMSVYFFFITIATSSINLATTRIVSNELTFSNYSGVKKAIYQCILFGLCFGIFSSILVCTFANIIATYWLHNKISSTPLYFIALALPFISMSSAINGYFCARRKIVKNSATQIFENFIKIIATVYLLSIFISKGIEFICLALIIGDFISEICSFVFIYALYRFDSRKLRPQTKANNIFLLTPAKSYIKDILHITIPVSLTSYIRSRSFYIKASSNSNKFRKIWPFV